MQADHENEETPVYEFGWWPEIAGAAGVIAVATFLIYFADGIL